MKLEQRILGSIPLLAPIPTAWMVYSACVDLLEFPFGIAIPAALVVEGLGFVAINLANRMREFNRHLNAAEHKQHMQAPLAQAYAIAGLYVIVVLSMTTVLHTFPTLAGFAPLPFVFMSVAGAWLWSLYADQLEREQSWLEGRSATRQRRSNVAQAKIQRRSAKTSDAASDAPAKSATLDLAQPELSDASRKNQPGPAAAQQPSDARAMLYRCECGFTDANRYKVAGHKRTCAIYQSHKSGQPIPVDLGTKVQR